MFLLRIISIPGITGIEPTNERASAERTDQYL
jgi:hypothetical protein